MDLISKLEDLKNFGIDLKLDSKEMEVFYIRSMKYFFDDKEHIYCTFATDRELTVSNNDIDLASIYVKDSILRIVPLDENPYAVVMDILEFVAHLHKPTIALYRELQEKKSIEKDLEGRITNEEDSDFDDEWI